MAGLATPAQVTRGPYLQSAGPDRITVCWRTDEPTTSEVAVGPDAATLGAPVILPGNRNAHFVTLTGLQAGSKYFYRITGTPESATAPVNVGGADHWFKTSPQKGTEAPLRMWVIGDSGSNLAYAPYIQFYAPSVALYQAYLSATAVAGKSTDFWTMLGDNAYNLGTDLEYKISVFDKYPALLRNAPLWPTIGNHDIASTPHPYTGPAPYDSIFALPAAGECGGIPSGTERFYSFDRGDVHFIALDSSTPGNFNNTAGSGGMMDWLIADLKATTATWIIVCFHHSPYSKGSHDSDTQEGMTSMRQSFGPVLEAYGVDLVLAGHSHVYERSGFISGHYGTSGTWNESMRKQTGNGSDLGGVNPDGSFVASSDAANGVYQKPMALSQSGTVYAVVGSSGTLSNWDNISPALVNPNPHPVHMVSLRLMGGLTVDTKGHRMICQYLDQSANIRDDFTILKGATYTLHPAAPTVENNTQGIAFPIIRSGSTAFAEQVHVAVEMLSGSGPPPAQGMAEFVAGQENALVKFFPPPGSSSIRFEASLLPATRSVQPGAAPRQAYRIAGDAQTGQFAATPAATWYASRFGSEPADPEVWDADDDGDGLSLLLEYALGGEPGRNDSALLPQGRIEGENFVLRYTRPHGRTDLTYRPLASADLATWPEPGPTDVNDGPATSLGVPRKVVLSPGSGPGFVKMMITLMP